MNQLLLNQSTKSIAFSQWQPATWADFIKVCEDPNLDQVKVFFDQGYLLVDLGNEGINHAKFNHLFNIIFFVWFLHHGQQPYEDVGGCVMEKPGKKGASPDRILYIGQGIPYWQPGEPRRINLDHHRVPDLVAEISDTTLATDLDEKKRLYASLEIPEYWIVNTIGLQVIAVRLQSDGNYQQITISQALTGLPISLLNATLAKLKESGNGAAAFWFAEQIKMQ